MGSCSLFVVVKPVLLLVVSFFVLVGVSKADSKNLKIFGRMLAFTLWIISVLAIICAIYTSSTGESSKMYKQHRGYKMMKCW